MNISELDLYQQYYVDGFYESSFKDNDDLDVLKRDMLSILNEDTGSGFYLEKKYPGTKDLRPNAYQYSDSFINILFSNNIPDMMLLAILDPESPKLPDDLRNGWKSKRKVYEITRSYLFNVHKKREQIKAIRGDVKIQYGS